MTYFQLMAFVVWSLKLVDFENKWYKIDKLNYGMYNLEVGLGSAKLYDFKVVAVGDLGQSPYNSIITMNGAKNILKILRFNEKI